MADVRVLWPLTLLGASMERKQGTIRDVRHGHDAPMLGQADPLLQLWHTAVAVQQKLELPLSSSNRGQRSGHAQSSPRIRMQQRAEHYATGAHYPLPHTVGSLVAPIRLRSLLLEF